MMSENESLVEVLQPVLAVLKRFGGEFLFTDEDGQQYVIARRSTKTSYSQTESDNQLPLPTSSQQNTADDVLDRINREIALYQVRQTDDEIEEASTLQTEETILEPPRRVRFEPLRGDLPPELQE